MSPQRLVRTRPLVATALIGVCAGLMTVGTSAHAEGGVIVRAGVGSGGDEIFTGTLTNGDIETIEAGEGLYFEVGGRGDLLGPGLHTDLTVGLQRGSVSADNGDASFERITLNLLQSFSLTESIRIGGGVTYHTSVELDVDIPGLRETVDFKPALGFMLSAAYMLYEGQIELGLRATQIDYEADISNAREIDGNNTGFYLTYRF